MYGYFSLRGVEHPSRMLQKLSCLISLRQHLESCLHLYARFATLLVLIENLAGAKWSRID